MPTAQMRGQHWASLGLLCELQAGAVTSSEPRRQMIIILSNDSRENTNTRFVVCLLASANLNSSTLIMDRVRSLVKKPSGSHRQPKGKAPNIAEYQAPDKQLDDLNKDIESCQRLVDDESNELGRLERLRSPDQLWVGYRGSADLEKQIDDTLARRADLEKMLLSFETERRRIERGLEEAAERDKEASSSH